MLNLLEIYNYEQRQQQDEQGHNEVVRKKDIMINTFQVRNKDNPNYFDKRDKASTNFQRKQNVSVL